MPNSLESNEHYKVEIGIVLAISLNRLWSQHEDFNIFINSFFSSLSDLRGLNRSTQIYLAEFFRIFID